MQLMTGILAHTPPWVFLLFAFLVWQGIQAMRPRTQSVWRLVLVPAIFLVIGLSMLVVRRSQGIWPPLAWLGAAILLLPLGLVTGPRLRAVDRATAQVTRTGSIVPLLRNVVLFSLQYGVAVLAALHPDDQLALAMLSRAVSGSTAGYFVGWSIMLWRGYRSAPALPRA